MSERTFTMYSKADAEARKKSDLLFIRAHEPNIA